MRFEQALPLGEHQVAQERLRLRMADGASKHGLLLVLRDIVSAYRDDQLVEVTKLRGALRHADFKVKTFVEFAAHQDRVINILGTRYQEFNACRDKREKREILKFNTTFFSPFR